MIYYTTAFLWLFLVGLCLMFGEWMDAPAGIAATLQAQAEAGGVFTWLWVWVRLIPLYILQLITFLFVITSPVTYFLTCRAASRANRDVVA